LGERKLPRATWVSLGPNPFFLMEIPFQLEGLLSANLPVSAEDVTVAFDMDEVFIEEDDY
jgi:hypothetical protein